MNINERLARLRARRIGSDRSERVSLNEQNQILRKLLEGEKYERRQPGRPYTRYALGAMDEVDANYTRISIETAGRVENHLNRKLPESGISAEFRLQGSVPLNVHIRGVSDVDLLVIATNSLFYSRAGARAQRGEYVPASLAPLALLEKLRRSSEGILEQAYPAADVDKAPAKAIKLSGGSLARPVDVVPAVWWDTVEYQRTYSEVDRGVSIYNKMERAAIDNLPFLHISRIAERDAQALGGLRKAIRLCKNLKVDAEEDGRVIGMSSYDIAALLYHADLAALRIGAVWELTILAEAQRHFDWCYSNPAEAQKLISPDGSRRILDTPERVSGLQTLSVQLDELTRKVAKEQSDELYFEERPSLEASRRALESALIVGN